MTDSAPKNEKPISNKTSAEARAAMQRAMAQLAVKDKDHSLARHAVRRAKTK